VTLDEALREAGSAKGLLALVTLAQASGSTPRDSGSRMAVRPDGRFVGTVGGGKPEGLARAEALACLAEGRSGRLSCDMAGASAKGADLICGGTAEFWIELVAPGSPYAAAVAAVEAGGTVVIASSADSGCLAVLGADASVLRSAVSGAAIDPAAARRAAASGLCELAGGVLYAPVEPPEELLVLGGGHVGLAVARAAASLAFRVTVADPRPEYSDPSRFPADVKCLHESFEEAIAGFPFGPRAYAVVVSPGHLGDLECARALMYKDYRYAGLIGSRRKTRMLIAQLIEEGFDRDKTEALRAPIGLDIGAETPEEIAIAIAAELIAVRHASPALKWIDADRKKRRE
jgi:xanthine dehydrogenase accessory factor